MSIQLNNTRTFNFRWFLILGGKKYPCFHSPFAIYSNDIFLCSIIPKKLSSGRIIPGFWGDWHSPPSLHSQPTMDAGLLLTSVSTRACPYSFLRERRMLRNSYCVWLIGDGGLAWGLLHPNFIKCTTTLSADWLTSRFLLIRHHALDNIRVFPTP